MSFNEIPEWFKWAFGGCGLSTFAVIGYFWKRKPKSNSLVIGAPVVPFPLNSEQSRTSGKPTKRKFKTIEEAKASARLLFIDDDTRFKLVKILKEAGWLNVDIRKDIDTEDALLRSADLVFVDINGVGKKMGFIDEGLGLSNAIRDKFPEKYIVIYSSERDGNRFDESIKKADDTLYKHADTYQFEKCIKNLLVE